MSIYDEEWVRMKIQDYLISQGYTRVTHEGKGHSHGVDIKCYSPKLCRYYFVEVKAEPQGKSKHAMKENYFLDVLGKILLRMNQINGRYALGLPITFKDKLKKLPEAIRRKLKLDVFFVGNDGSVSKLPYHKSIDAII